MSGTWTATRTTRPSGRTTCISSPSVSSVDPGAPPSTLDPLNGLTTRPRPRSGASGPMRRISEPARRSTTWLALVAVCLLARAGVARADGPATLEVDAGKPGVTIPADFFGLMTEEINHSYDGGL